MLLKNDYPNEIGQISKDYISSFQKQVNDLNELLDSKQDQIKSLTQENGSLRTYASKLKHEVEKIYEEKG